MRSGRERLMDILDAIEKVERYLARGKKAFDSEELLQVRGIHKFHKGALSKDC